MPIITPFDARGRLDTARLRDLLHLLAAAPLTGFVVLGSTGEACLLTEAERNAVVRAARRALPRRPIIAGTGDESTALTVARTARAAGEGADGVLVLAPGFYRRAVSEGALGRHYAAVARAARIPVLLYQFPQANGFAFAPESVRRLRSQAGVAGIKDSLGEPEAIRRWVREGGAGFSVAVGSAKSFLPALDAGAGGAVLAVANIAPRLCAALLEAHRSGRRAEASRLQRAVDRLSATVGALGPAGCKAALGLLGFDPGPPRAPLEEPSPAELAAMRLVLAELRSEARA